MNAPDPAPIRSGVYVDPASVCNVVFLVCEPDSADMDLLHGRCNDKSSQTGSG